MFIIKITYTAELSEVDRYVKSHRDFLDMHYQSGMFLASGPMNPRTGGIIVALGSDKSQIEQILADDPYKQAGVAEYEIIEFTAVKSLPEIKQLIRNVGDANI